MKKLSFVLLALLLLSPAPAVRAAAPAEAGEVRQTAALMTEAPDLGALPVLPYNVPTTVTKTAGEFPAYVKVPPAVSRAYSVHTDDGHTQVCVE
jgi:hypothetical protein